MPSTLKLKDSKQARQRDLLSEMPKTSNITAARRRRRAAQTNSEQPSRDLLQQLAQAHGIQTDYQDMAGQQKQVSVETLRALLDFWGIPTDSTSALRHALQEVRNQRWEHAFDPVCAAWQGRENELEIRLPAHLKKRQLRCEIFFEDGHAQRLALDPERLPTGKRAGIQGTEFAAKRFRLPELPPGYHELELETPDRLFRCRILSAPPVTYSNPEAASQWGVFLPMYAAHSQESWGAGNFSDWSRLCEWVGSLGGTFVSTLPILAAFLDQPVCQPSPYSPASRLFWNEFYLDLTKLPEFQQCRSAQNLVRSAPFQNQLEEFRRNRYIDYQAQMKVRGDVLARLAEFFFKGDSPRRQKFRQFLRGRPETEDYARFRAACDQAKTSWHNWPQPMREGRLRKGDYDETRKQYYLYGQWAAQEQMNELLAHCRAKGVQFYLDLPLGVNADGYDVWRARDSFAMQASAGAPPDLFYTKGQDWGFSPLHPQRIRDQGYQYVIDYLRFQMRHTGMLRIDHVMSLHRLYWIPKGFPASQGAYVSYRAEELYAILSLESHRFKTVLVGENLGTVPPEVNRSMNRHHLREMYVAQYAQRPDPKQALPRPPRRAVASLNTHDMPTFTAHWKELDIADRADLGLIPKGNLGAVRSERRRLKLALIEFLTKQGYLQSKRPDAKCVVAACLKWLSTAPSEFLLVNLEDLWFETQPQNVPGTWMERPNWKRKSALALEEILDHPDIREWLKTIHNRRCAVSGP